MWPTGGGYGFYPGWPQAAASNNPIPQESNPSEWAAKAAQWAQQRTIQEQVYQQQLQAQQQQYAALMAQQQQQASVQGYQQSSQQPPTSTLAAPTPVQGFQQTPQQPAAPVQQYGSQQAQSVNTQPSHAQPLFPPQDTSQQQIQPPTPQDSVKPATSAESSGLGPGHIENPPMNEPANRYSIRNPDFQRGGGFRGRGSQPPRREFRPRGGDFRYRSPYGGRGMTRPRMPHPSRPRGPSPRHWDQGYNQSSNRFERDHRGPGMYDQEEEEEEEFHEHSGPGSSVTQSREELGRGPREPEAHKGDDYRAPINSVEQALWPKDNEKNEFKRGERRETYPDDDYDRERNSVMFKQTPPVERQRERPVFPRDVQVEREIEPPIVSHKRQFDGGPPSGIGEKVSKDLLKIRLEQEDHELYASPAAESSQKHQPTISSLREEAVSSGVIPGLGELDNAAAPTEPQAEKEPKSEQADKMLASLGKLMTELQGLKGLTSSLQLLQALPKGQAVSELQKQVREKDLSEEAKQKVAALLANESDSDGESQPVPKEPYRTPPPRAAQLVAHYGNKQPSDQSQAREFDGYNVKPQVYGIYSNQDDYPRDQSPRRPRDNYRGETDYPPEYSRGDSYGQGGENMDCDYPPNSQPRREGPPHSSEEYYPPRERYDHNYPPPSEPYRERGGVHFESHDYDHGRGPSGGQGGYRERDYPPGEGPPVKEGRYPPADNPPQEYRRGVPPPQGGREEYEYGEVPSHMPGGREREEERYHDHMPPDRPFSGAPIESYDYDHGGTPAVVDYNHGKGGRGQGNVSPPPERSAPRMVDPQPRGYEGASMDPQGYGQYPMPGGGVDQLSSGYPGYMAGPGMASFGAGFPPGMPYFPAGVDPAQAALLAAYTAQAGEAKRKALPSWLRDELEKMEAKRQKELEKEAKQARKAEAELEGRPTWRDEIDSEEEEGTKKKEKNSELGKHESSRSKRSYRQQSPSPQRRSDRSPSPKVKRKKKDPPLVEDEEEKEVGMIMKIRRMLTELLLDVTNNEIEAVAIEIIEEEKKPKLAFEFKNQGMFLPGDNVLAGLSMYDSDSESDHDGKKRHRKQGKSQPALPANPLLDPLTIAKAFSDSSSTYIVDPEYTALPPPSKEHQEWADKLLSDLSGSSHKNVSKHRRSSSKDKRERSYSSSHRDSDRRSSQDERSKSSKSSKTPSSSHKKGSSTSTPSSGSRDSSKHKGPSRSHSKSGTSPSSNSTPGKSKGSSSRRRSRSRSHSPPPPSGMTFTAAFPPAKASSTVSSTSSVRKPSSGGRVEDTSGTPKSESKSGARGKSLSSGGSGRSRNRSPSPSPLMRSQQTRKRQRSPSPSPVERRVSYRNEGAGKRGRSRSRSPVRSGNRSQGLARRGRSRSRSKSPTWSGQRSQASNSGFRVVSRK